MPLSRREAARARQLANLTPRPPTPPEGNQRARRHGGYAVVAAKRMEAKAAEVFDAVAADAPLRDHDGGLPAADAALVRLTAEALCRLEDVSANIRDHGLLDGKGDVRPVVDLERRLRAEVADHLDALGMSPRSRAKLGLDVARMADLSTAMSEPDPYRRADLMAAAGVPIDSDAEEGTGD